MPNSKLISEPVTNWTFSQRRRLVTMPVTVAAGAEPERVMDLLRKAAAAHPLVSKEYPIRALLTGITDGTANFELRAWTERPEDWQQVRSDLFISIRGDLSGEGISLK